MPPKPSRGEPHSKWRTHLLLSSFSVQLHPTVGAWLKMADSLLLHSSVSGHDPSSGDEKPLYIRVAEDHVNVRHRLHQDHLDRGAHILWQGV